MMAGALPGFFFHDMVFVTVPGLEEHETAFPVLELFTLLWANLILPCCISLSLNTKRCVSSIRSCNA